MKKMKCIRPRKVVWIMRDFANVAASSLIIDGVPASVKLDNTGRFGAFLHGVYPKSIITIGYGFDGLTDKGQKQFRKDFTERSKVAKGFADITITLLHEIGHFMTEEVNKSYDRRKAIRNLWDKFPQETINFEYFKLPDEKAATDWAIDWLSNPDNRKVAKAFEKKFFTCFK